MKYVLLLLIFCSLSNAAETPGSDSTTDYFLRTQDAIQLDTKSLGLPGPTSPINTFPITLGRDRRPDPSSYLYQALRRLIDNPNIIEKTRVTVDQRERTYVGTVVLSKDEKFNIALNFLTQADNTFHWSDGKIIRDEGVSEPVLQYLKTFFPNAFAKIDEVKSLAESSGVKDILARQKDAKSMAKSFAFAIKQLQELSIFIEGYSHLSREDVFVNNPEQNEGFVNKADQLFASTARAFNEVTSTRLAKDKMSESDTQEYLKKLGTLFVSALSTNTTRQTQEIMTAVLNRRFERASRLMARGAADRVIDFVKHRITTVDALIGLGALAMLRSGDKADFIAGLGLLGILQLGNIKERRQTSQELRLIQAVLSGNELDFCKVGMGS